MRTTPDGVAVARMEASRRVWQGVEFGLFGLVAGLLILGVRLAVQTAGVRMPVVEPAAVPTPAALVQPLDAYAVIERRNIFGGERRTASAAAPVILRGVGIHAGVMRAVIEDPATHEQRLVRSGDIVGEGHVATIAWDHLILSGPSGDQTLQLAPPDGSPPTSDTSAPTPTAANSSGVRRTGADAFIVDRRELTGALDGMSGLVSQLRAVAEIADGRPAGFRIFQIAEQSLFARLGLENGDVVQRVNGKAVTDPAALLGFLKQLRSEPRVALDVVRAGTPRTLVYDLR